MSQEEKSDKPSRPPRPSISLKKRNFENDPVQIKRSISSKLRVSQAPKVPKIKTTGLVKIKSPLAPTRRTVGKLTQSPARRKKNHTAISSANKAKTGIKIAQYRPINSMIPHQRSFIDLSSSSSFVAARKKGLLGNLRKNVKGLFDAGKIKGIDKNDLVKLRKTVGNLKDLGSIDNDNTKDKKEQKEELAASRPKTKKELLEEKRKSISQKSKSDKKSPTVGMRIEIEKLKKEFPDEPNLGILSAILTVKDTYSTHRSPTERINSLHAALQEAGVVVLTRYLTTYSIDTLCDIYFLYLETLKSKLVADLKTTPKDDIDSLRRDIKVMQILLDQKRLKKSISNIANKLDGFGYPFEALTSSNVAKTFKASEEENDKRIGPGTVKLNKFLIRLYLNVFSQIPAFQPLARTMIDVLPTNKQGRSLVASVNIENAYVKMQITKLNRTPDFSKLPLSIYNYAKSVIGENFVESVTSSVEAKILLRIAQMVEEFSLLATNLDPKVIIYGYKCASIALHYFKEDAERLLNKISDIAARQQLELN